MERGKRGNNSELEPNNTCGGTAGGGEMYTFKGVKKTKE